MVFDICVIGAGVVGALISRELSKYEVSVCLIDKENDIAVHTSSANSGIVHAGYDCRPGTLKAALNVRGNELMPALTAELDVPFKQTGSLVVAFNEEEAATLNKLKSYGGQNGVPGLELLDAARTAEMEPALSKSVVGSLYAPTAGIVCPYELTLGAAENAIANGAQLRLNFETESISYDKDCGCFIIRSKDGREIAARYAINAAGLYSDRIAGMVGEIPLKITPKKGEYMLFDNTIGGMVKNVIFMTPTPKGKGILVMPTVDGNLLIGPNSVQVDDVEDVDTTATGLTEIYAGACRSVPGIPRNMIINSFAGNRASTEGYDFYIKPDPVNTRFINLIGIDSPGLTSSPAIAEYVAAMLKDAGLLLAPKPDFDPVRPKMFKLRKSTVDEINRKIAENPLYGNIVCRCEKVSEGEIIDSIRRTVGATCLDGVKRRTRAGMGRCSGGFCTPRVLQIMARELGIDMTDVVKNSPNSRILMCETKQNGAGNGECACGKS